MKFHVLGTGSKGNGYLLISEKSEVLIIEAGLKLLDVKKSLSYNLTGVVGCVLSHLHMDHSKYVKDYLANGIDLYASRGTLEALKLQDHYRSHAMKQGQSVQIGSFKVLPFDIVHDAPEPFGFLIQHPEMGTALFLTDTHYSKYKFNGLNHMIVEINYSDEILDKKNTPQFLRDRIINSHLSLENCLGMLDANDLSKVRNIALIHLSDRNSDEQAFVNAVVNKTGIPTHGCNAGDVLDFSLEPF